MRAQKILIVGGTGTISQAVTELAVRRGHAVTLLNRGRRPHGLGSQVETVVADTSDRPALQAALAGRSFDVVANFIAFTAADFAADLELFRRRTGQYLTISSASAYQKPPNHYRITESTPLHNPFWQYSRNKIAMETAALTAYREENFPITIVRPSYTYSHSSVPGLFGLGFQHFVRLQQGRPLAVHGDGQSLWQMTWNEDFAVGCVGLFGNPRALGEAFHITTDEVLTWDQIFQTMARVVGVTAQLVHVPVEFIGRVEPSVYDGLKGDKMYSLVLDNTKIKSVLPEYAPRTGFYDGMCRCYAWLQAHPELAAAPAGSPAALANTKVDRVLAAWDRALAMFPPR